MSAKNLVKLSSGNKYDLSELSGKELAELRNAAIAQIEKSEEDLETLFKKSDEYKNLKAEFKALVKEIKGLSGSYEFEASIPLKFKVKVGATSYYYDDEWDFERLFDAQTDVKVGKGFSKELTEYIQELIDDTNFCYEVLNLNPEIYKQFQQCIDKFKAFQKKKDDSSVEVTYEDLKS